MPEYNNLGTSTAATFTPFWHRLPAFFVYPMQLGSMLRIAGYSVFGGISMFIPAPFNSILYLILWIVFLKYAFLVMERTANGRFDEPNNLSGNENGDATQVIRQFGLFFVIGLILYLVASMFGEIGYDLGSLLLNLMIPAGIMIIAVEHSLWQAINPAKIFFYIRTIGSPYLALCFFLISLTTSGDWLQGFLYQHMDSWLALPLLSFIEFYFALITYHMMGYALYQYHEQLGISAAVSFDEATAKVAPGKAADPVLSKLSALIADGKQDEAIELLRNELRTQWERNDLHDRYQKLLLAAGKQTEALHHAREFIFKLVKEKRLFQALDICEQCLKIDPEFQLQDSFQVHELASAARMTKRTKLSLDLMRRFDRRYPGHPHIPPVYLLSAQILSEHYRQDQQAKQILHALQAKFPNHELAQEARQYLEVLNKLSTIG